MSNSSLNEQYFELVYGATQAHYPLVCFLISWGALGKCKLKLEVSFFHQSNTVSLQS